MTPSERERRIEAAWHAYWEAGPSFTAAGDKHAMRAALDAADEAVPVVSEAQVIANICAEALIESVWQERAERAEAAAQELTEQHALQRAEWARVLMAESERADRAEAELGRCTCPVGFGQVRAATAHATTRGQDTPWSFQMSEFIGPSWDEIKHLVATANLCRMAMVGFSEEERQELIEVARQHGTEIEWLIDTTQMHGGMPDA